MECTLIRKYFRPACIYCYVGELRRRSPREPIHRTHKRVPPPTPHCALVYPQHYRSIYVGDLDRDGFPDVVVAFEGTGQVTWFRNTDGLGSFSAGIDIATDVDAAAWVTLSDIDDDGDLDAISASGGDSGVCS